MSNSPSQAQREKAIRLVDYLLRLASLRTKLVRDIAENDRPPLWLAKIPHERGCFTQAWGRDEEHEPDDWIEIQNQREPELPTVPVPCQDWIDRSSLRNKKDLPELLPEITRQIQNPAWRQESDQPELISRTERLQDYPEVQSTWRRYVEERWLAWTEVHNSWESVHTVYSALFAMHQEQIRLGEEYELVLGLGLLTWQTPTSQRVRRHLIVANALLEFEARNQRFTVKPHPDGTKLRPELDMLDAFQPPQAEETAKAGLMFPSTNYDSGQNHQPEPLEDPWEKLIIDGVLMGLAHSFSSATANGEPVHGEYHDRLENEASSATPKPIVEYAPALILRKRSAKGLTETLLRIKERIEKGEEIPGEFGDLAEIRTSRDTESENDPGEANTEFDGEVFFPKPSNEEQRRIVDKIRRSSGVLVQGPPGTGKSHTIANLICHLLATGNRILVTAKTPRALQVLLGEICEEESRDSRKAKQDEKKYKGLIPEEMKSLCISLLGSGLEEKNSLESSVNGILRKHEEWNESRATKDREAFQKKLHGLREEKATVGKRLRDIRESETHSQSIAEGTYRGTAARIAEAVNRDRTAYEWFADTAPMDKTCPISENDLRTVLAALRHFTPERRHELSLGWPEALPSPERFANLIECEKRAIEEEAHSASGADECLVDLLSKSRVAIIEMIRASLSNFHDTQKRLSASPHAWMRDALRDIMGGNSSLWRELSRVTRDTSASIKTLVPVADDTSLNFPDGSNIRALYEDVCKLKEHMENGGKLGWGPFRPKPVKDRIHVLKTVQVNGHAPSNLEHLSMLADVLRVRLECEKAWGFWLGRCEKTPGPYGLQLPALNALHNALDDALMLDGLIGKCREAFQLCPTLGEPLWPDETQVEQLMASCRLALARHSKRLAADEISSIEAPVSSFAAKDNAHPVTNELLRAIRSRDIDAFARCRNTIQEMEKARQRVQMVDEYISKMRLRLPRLTNELERTCSDPCWETRIPQIQNACHWAQARHWIEEYIRKEDAPALATRAKQIEDEVNVTIANLASLHAWSFCFSRLKEDHRRNMKAWQKNVSKITRSGTGKQDFFHRKEAQKNLNNCREAIPAWVMPLHRVWDTVEPAPGLFDVIIIDEASQCGFEALPLFYMAKSILIVGDDKQISPGAEGVKLEPVTQLINQFLHDFEFKASFNINRSLFDHGELRFSSNRIVLREHFRCMPEIIRFSNDLCYSDTPLIPMRQYGPDRLTPLEPVMVSSGYREGSNARVINRPEANAIVEKILELCQDKRYESKTMGVIVLQGDAQAGLIEGNLLERLGAVEMHKRRLVCGNAYSFQGDERDIIFLSMVAAPNERIGPLKEEDDQRRFNVAASRARDQMWLFHSVTCNDLNKSCFRRRLLDVFENTKPQEIAGIARDEIERRAFQDNRRIVSPPKPFESWFEVDVALELLRKGFDVRPQFEFAGKWIDLVVEGGQARLAVECDGDHWHGLDRYEDDMTRTRRLERCGWEFFRVRESAFYSNKDKALQGLWRALEERGIHPFRGAESAE